MTGKTVMRSKNDTIKIFTKEPETQSKKNIVISGNIEINNETIVSLFI